MKNQLSGPVRVRFAPSPTGYLHVGGARTAVYNELLRQRLGGAFILRIEDTDRERSNAAMTEQIITALEWIGIDIDEGPFLQSAQLDRHVSAAAELLDKGLAYRCFRSPEELETEREAVLARGDSYRYRTSFPAVPADEAEQRAAGGEAHVIRLRMPTEAIEVDDLVRGTVTFPEEMLDDFILLRSDGTPTYHLSVVCDDIDMNISHVIRGEDHLSNVPKHVALFRALGARVPVFAHLPLILGSDKKRLSKRTGAASVEEFRDRGILPQGLYNYLALLGWSPGDDREIFDRNELIEVFSADRLLGSAAVFDEDKVEWINAQHITRAPLSEIVERVKPFLHSHALEIEEPRLTRAVEAHRSRARTLESLAEMLKPYSVPELSYQAELCAKFLRQEPLVDQLDELIRRYQNLETFDIETTEKVMRETAADLEIGAGKLIHPTRMALTADQKGPPLFDVVAAMGQDATVRHLQNFQEFLRTNRVP